MVRSREHAELLLGKAAQDEFTVEKLLPDPESPDEVIGFHAQQAVEKLVKAVLSLHSIRYRRTHDLAELVDLLRDSGIAFPAGLDEIRRLSPFAVAFRYDDLPIESEGPFDRSWSANCVRKIRSWAEAALREYGS